MSRRLKQLILLSTLAVLLTTGAARIWCSDPVRAEDRRVPEFTIPAPLPGGSYERAFVLGDMGTGKKGQKKVARIMAKRAAADGLDFMLTVGDNFYSDGLTSLADPIFKEYFEDVYLVHESLRVPVRPTLGNHDHQGNAAAQIEVSRIQPLWRMPALYYTFRRDLEDGTRVQYFALDTDPIHNGRIEEACPQIHWLESELEQSEAHWKIVYGHHPLRSNGKHSGSKRTRRSLGPILRQHGVDLYLAGHDHILEMLQPQGGLHLVIAGAAGGPEKAYDIAEDADSIYAATGGGVVGLRVGRENLVLEFIRMDGAIEFAYTIDKPGP